MPQIPNNSILFPKTAISDGVNLLGTSSNPIRNDPTGTTTQPVSVVGNVGLALNATNQISIGVVATQIVAANATRAGIIVTNPSSSVTVYLGTSGVTISNGQILLPGNSASIPTVSAVFGIVAAATQTVSFIELV